MSANRHFVEVTGATVFEVPKKRLPINPFILREYDEQSILISAREKAESFASIATSFGVVQKGILTDAIVRAYGRRAKQEVQFPDFREITTIVSDLYVENERKDDTLVQVLRDLTSFGLFHDHTAASEPLSTLRNQTCIIDLHQLPVLKELVAYLVIERIYKEISALPDSPVQDGIRLMRTILIIDEAHNYLNQKNIFLQKLVREGRSKGVAVFFASQSPSDYSQKTFDFQELLEFSFMFQCEGANAGTIQEFLSCTPGEAKSLQSGIANLRPFEAFTRSMLGRRGPTKFKAATFYENYLHPSK